MSKQLRVSFILIAQAGWAIACSSEAPTQPEQHSLSLEPCGPVGDAGSLSADAAPPSQSVDCRVSLSKLSYDSPAADDAELIELRVDGIQASSTIPVVFGQCDYHRIELVNGGGATCSVYRSIDLSEVAVPASGYLVICAAGSRLATRGACDVTSAGGSPLSNGWLQNGPSDGIRLIGDSAESFSYEGVPSSCTSDNWHELPIDTGMPIDGLDDVIAECRGGFVRLSAEAAPLHAEADCPIGTDIDAGISSDAAIAPHAPAPRDGGPSSVALPRGSLDLESESIDVAKLRGIEISNDAGRNTSDSPKDAGQVPQRSLDLAPSCRFGASAPRGNGALGYGAVSFLMLWCWRRREL